MLALELLTVAYTPTPLHRAPAVCQSRVGNVRCALEEPVAPRRAVLAAALGMAATGAAPAFAAYGSGLGIVTTAPADAEKDAELLGSSQVKKALSDLKSYKQKASALQVPPAQHTQPPHPLSPASPAWPWASSRAPSRRT
tara:strand:- start:871 stop:1290 length:420 start_codon:yes stop_codon:yes gene_type:complete